MMEQGFPSQRQADGRLTPEQERETMAQREERLRRVLEERLHRQRSIFSPGSRMRMNIIPMFVNVLLPWLVFFFCCGLTSFSVMYTEPGLARVLIAFVFVLWLGLLSFAVRQKKINPDPTWFSYAAVALGIAAISGVTCGLYNFESLSRPYYEIQDLKVIHQLHTGSEQGQNFMDAGIVYFAQGSDLDRHKSWHFKHHKLYCVAPIVDSSSQLTLSAEPHVSEVSQGPQGSYDFWAVGEDCCSPSSSDFRCGPWDNASVRSAIRVLDDSVIPFYRLAVQQAETLYGVVAAHPVFFKWSEDPLAEVNSWSMKAFRNYLFMVALALVVSIFSLAITTCRFSLLGRKGSLLQRDFYDQSWEDIRSSTDWRKGVTEYKGKYSSL